MQTMDTGFVKISMCRYADTTQVLFMRTHPDRVSFVMSLSDSEVDEFVNKLVQESHSRRVG